MIDSGFDVGGARDDTAGAEESEQAAIDRVKAETTTRLWRELIELDDRFHKQRKIRLLTPEARVLLHLKLNGPVSVTAAMEVAGTSYRGFYAVLERLRQAGIVASVKDDQDQRVRKLNIHPSAPHFP